VGSEANKTSVIPAIQVSGVIPAVLGYMLSVAGISVAGTLADPVALLTRVVRSTPVTPSSVSTGGSTVPRRRFQKGTMIIRGKKRVLCFKLRRAFSFARKFN
jgi:hypothetical protein